MCLNGWEQPREVACEALELGMEGACVGDGGGGGSGGTVAGGGAK